MNLEFTWVDGETGDYWLTVGLIEKVGHVFQTPWSENTWWVITEFNSVDKKGFYTLAEALSSTEQMVKDWMKRASYETPSVYDFSSEQIPFNF